MIDDPFASATIPETEDVEAELRSDVEGGAMGVTAQGTALSPAAARLPDDSYPRLAQAQTGTLSDAIPPEADPLARLRALTGKIDDDYQKKIADRSNADALKWLSSIGEESGTPILPDEPMSGDEGIWAGSGAMVQGAKAVAKDVGGALYKDPANIVVGGPLKAAAAALDLMDQAATWLNKNVADTRFDKAGVPIQDYAGANVASIVPNPGGVMDQPQTVTGTILQGITQFLTGFALAGRATGIGNTFPGLMAKGAIADFGAFKGTEENVASFIQSFPSLQNPVTEFLATDKDNPDIEGRLKNALIGAGFGAALEPVLLGLRAIREARRAKALTGASTYEEAADRLAKGGLETGEAQAPQTGSRIDELLGKQEDDLVKVVERPSDLGSTSSAHGASTAAALPVMGGATSNLL
jgi:hypothetical protein